jgi:hypothetical protein
MVVSSKNAMILSSCSSGLWGFELWGWVGSEGRKCRMWPDKQQALQGTEITAWHLSDHRGISCGEHLSPPLLQSLKMHSNSWELSWKYWKRPRELHKRVKCHNSSLRQIKHAIECISWWKLQVASGHTKSGGVIISVPAHNSRQTTMMESSLTETRM